MADNLRNISLFGLVSFIWAILSAYFPNKAGYQIILILLILTGMIGFLSFLYKDNRKILRYFVMNTTIFVSASVSYSINSIISMNSEIIGISSKHILIALLSISNLIMLLILFHSSKDRTIRDIEKEIKSSDESFKTSVLRYLITINPQYEGELEIQGKYVKEYIEKYKNHGSVSKSLETKAQNRMEDYIHMIVAVQVFSIFILFILLSLLLSSIYISSHSNTSIIFTITFFSNIAMLFFISLWFVVEASDTEAVPSPYLLFSIGFCFVLVVYSNGILAINPVHVFVLLVAFVISYYTAKFLAKLLLRNIYDIGVRRLRQDKNYRGGIEELVKENEFTLFGNNQIKRESVNFSSLKYAGIPMRVTSKISYIYRLINKKFQELREKTSD